LLLKNPFFFGCTIIVLAALQVGTSYLSFHSFLEGDVLLAFLFFLFVPGLGFLMVLYFLWFRKNKLSPQRAQRE
jgi:hypothetical protein